MNKLCLPLVGLLVAALLGMAYLFVWRGAVLPASDGRTAILLDAGERDRVLAEMRAFLEAVQQISAAVAAEDMPAIGEAATRVGAAAQQAVPATLVGKLPLEFKTLGFDTHQRFDQLALDAAELGDETVALKQLSEIMLNCVGCHGAYRIDAPAQKH
jgi:hypothetical protein